MIEPFLYDLQGCSVDIEPYWVQNIALQCRIDPLSCCKASSALFS